jgi:hypothetical protein
MKISITVCVGLCALVAIALADPVFETKESSTGGSESHRGAESSSEASENPISIWPPTVDLRTQLAGTVWKAAPGGAGLRPGLEATLAFNGKDVGLQGYRYEVNSHDGTVTIFFTRGDTQLMLLTEGGRHLRFTFRGEDYSYDFVSKTPPAYSQNP